MLKADLIIILALLLQLDWDLSKVIAYVLMILSGLSLSTAYELKKGTLTRKSFLIRLLQVFALTIVSYYIWNIYFPKRDYLLTLFLCSLFSDTIVSVGYKIGEMGIAGYLRHLAGMLPQDKRSEND